MIAIHLTFGIHIGLFLVLSGFLFAGKGTILVNGMLLMPKAARDKVNKKALGRFVSLFLIILSATMALMWIDLAWLETAYLWLTWVSAGIMLAACVVFIIIGTLKREEWFSVKDDGDE